MSVQDIAEDTGSTAEKLVNTITQPRYLGVLGVATAGVTYVAAKKAGISNVSDIELTTEQAVSSFSLLAGIGGAAAQLIAGQRLSKLSQERIPVTKMAMPLAISIGASAGSAFLLPSEM